MYWLNTCRCRSFTRRKVEFPEMQGNLTGNLAFQVQGCIGQNLIPLNHEILYYVVPEMPDFMSNSPVTHFRKFHFFLL